MVKMYICPKCGRPQHHIETDLHSCDCGHHWETHYQITISEIHDKVEGYVEDCGNGEIIDLYNYLFKPDEVDNENVDFSN